MAWASGEPERSASPGHAGVAAATNAAPWGTPGERFAALGDDDGLFIVVERERAWFPTTRRAGVFPVTMTVAGHRDGTFRMPGTPYVVVTRVG